MSRNEQPTLIELLRQRAQQEGDRPAYNSSEATSKTSETFG